MTTFSVLSVGLTFAAKDENTPVCSLLTVTAFVCLGDGSYSSVYKVKRQEDNQIYALKKVKIQNLSDREKENALNEVRILASIKNPFVAAYKQAFFDEPSNSLW